MSACITKRRNQRKDVCAFCASRRKTYPHLAGIAAGFLPRCYKTWPADPNDWKI